MWGPGPFYTNYEPYTEAREGNRLVQYFDKGRLEIDDPDADPRSPWFVTGGLLVTEMVSGQAATGDRTALSLGPARVPVAGDAGDAGDFGAPTYASFAGLLSRTSDRAGATLDQHLSAGGTVARSPAPPTPLRIARYESATGHNWAEVFWRFANGPSRPAGFDWLFTLGYPITEPYWANVKVGGEPQTVLVQLFQRRSLTFNPSNPSQTQVEMGNVGRHYYNWRYSQPPSPELDVAYNVRIRVGTAPRRAVAVEETVALKNTTEQPLNSIVLRAIWNHWQDAFTLRSASVNGVPVNTRWRNEVNLDALLPRPLPPGGEVELRFSFEVTPRPVGGRSAYDRANDILSLGDMLPTVVPWENGGWAAYPYSDLGDHGYYAVADYAVEISSSASERLIVGGTGKITGVNPAKTEWRFEARRVRDVAYVISPRFMDPLADSSLSRRQGNVTMLAYFLPAHRSQALRQLDLTAPALDWFSRRIGPYPFDTYTVAEMGVPQLRSDNYAQEYPMAYFVPTTWLGLGTAPGTWTWYIPVHEVAHQWFYSNIGSNQLIDPWLDEALTSFITAEYVRANFPEHYARSFASMTASATVRKPVSSGLFSGFANENDYSATVYDGGVAMLDRVRRAMGDAAFYEALQSYHAQYQTKRARPADLLTLLQSHTTTDLKPIFSHYLGY
jgi:hypothetical protein